MIVQDYPDKSGDVCTVAVPSSTPFSPTTSSVHPYPFQMQKRVFAKKVCGAAGSAWKMYISPIHAVMVLHNVETNEEVWDYKATELDLLRVVKDNIVGLGGITAKARAAKEREQEWDKLLRDRCHTNCTSVEFCKGVLRAVLIKAKFVDFFFFLFLDSLQLLASPR